MSAEGRMRQDLLLALKLAAEDYRDAKGKISDQGFTETCVELVTAWCDWHIKGRQ